MLSLCAVTMLHYAVTLCYHHACTVLSLYDVSADIVASLFGIIVGTVASPFGITVGYVASFHGVTPTLSDG